MKKYLIFLALLVVTLQVTVAQTYLPFEQIRGYTRTQPANKYDSSFKFLKNRLGPGIHYLYPFYQAIGWEDRFKRTMGEKGFHTSFADLLSFAGDYSKAVEFQEKNYDTISSSVIEAIRDTINKLKKIQYAPAQASIISNAPHYRVIMINESHSKPVHRAFTYSLLEDLYKEGFRYFAMEAFNNFSNKFLDSLNVFTGYYTYEPVAGELVRKALELGFKLVAYEDTLATSHTPSQRDSVQAVNLFAIIQNDPSAKILVHAGNTHISEQKIGNYSPMGYWFRTMSGIDPFTINQTGMTEGSEFEYGRTFYQYFNARFTLAEPSIIFQDKRQFNPLEEKGFDIIIMHPSSTYRHNRPSWLSFEGERKITLIQPTAKMLFFVQAYYAKEYDADLLPYIVPADQTYISSREGYYGLYLRKGVYKIVLRDVSYKILGVKDLEVL